MRGIEINKIAASVLLAGLVAMISGAVTRGLYWGGEHEEKAEKRGYTVPGAEQFAEGAAGAAPAAAQGPVDILPLLAKADATKGEAVSKRCLSCHTFGKGEPNKVGPNLWGVVGNTHAHKDDYAYSDAMAAGKGKEKWDFQSLSDFLTHPQQTIKGTKMTFGGISKPEERADLLAWLRTQSDAPVPIPAAKEQPKVVAPENPAGGAATTLPPKKGPAPTSPGASAPQTAVTDKGSGGIPKQPAPAQPATAQPAAAKPAAKSATSAPHAAAIHKHPAKTGEKETALLLPAKLPPKAK